MSTLTKQTHTPGPWRYLPHAGDAVIRGPKHSDGSSILIAVMGEHIEAPDDARLIAAAPELLEALEEISKRDPGGETCEGDCNCIGCVARAAIRKAKQE